MVSFWGSTLLFFSYIQASCLQHDHTLLAPLVKDSVNAIVFCMYNFIIKLLNIEINTTLIQTITIPSSSAAPVLSSVAGTLAGCD